MDVIPSRQTTRRAATFALSLAAASLVLAGCGAGGSSADGGDGKTLSVWFPGNNQSEIDLVTNKIVPEFEQETGADVEVTFVDWGDMSTKLNAAFAAGTAPDVFGHGPAAVADFVANERLTPLTDDIDGLPQSDRDDLADVLPGGQVDGTQYLIPLSSQGYLVMYDAAAFTAAGLDPSNPPTTWEEVRADAEKLTQRDASGTITRAGLLLPSQTTVRQQTFTTLLAGAGGSLLDDGSSQATWDSDAGVKALDYFTGLYAGDDAVSTDLGADYLNAPAAQQPLVLGTAAMTMLGATQMKAVVEASPDKDLRVLPPLAFAGESAAAIGGAGPGLMINADSKEQDLAWKFISYMISPDVSTEYTQGIGAIPVRSSAADTDYVQSSPVVQAFLAAGSSWVANPNVAGWVQIRDVLDKNLEQALNGASSAKDALTAAASEADGLLQSKK